MVLRWAWGVNVGVGVGVPIAVAMAGRENHCRQLQRGCIRMLWRVGGEFGNAISVCGSTCVR